MSHLRSATGLWLAAEQLPERKQIARTDLTIWETPLVAQGSSAQSTTGESSTTERRRCGKRAA